MIKRSQFAVSLAGTVLENAYRLTRLIGEGGMGAVYEAVHLRLNKRVAIKLLASELSTNSEALARFHREAQITSHLGHPHLVNVSDFGVAATGEPYLPEQVYGVIETQLTYLRAIGAVGPVVDTGELPD